MVDNSHEYDEEFRKSFLNLWCGWRNLKKLNFGDCTVFGITTLVFNGEYFSNSKVEISY